MNMQEFKDALKKLDLMRRERNRKLKEADRIEASISSVGTSHIYDSIGASHQRSRHSPQELMVEVIDLRRSALKDRETMSEIKYQLEEELDNIEGLSWITRDVIRYRYLWGYKVAEIAEIYPSLGINGIYDTIDNFFAS